MCMCVCVCVCMCVCVRVCVEEGCSVQSADKWIVLSVD